MGRRKKVDILENPEEHDFELRPRHIIPAGFETEAFTLLDGVFEKFNLGNPLLNFVVATDEATHFRYETEVTLPPDLDLLDRPVGDPKLLKLRIHAKCCRLDEPLQEAYLFSEEEGVRAFNNWEDVEIEFKGTEDPRLRKLMKYP